MCSAAHRSPERLIPLPCSCYTRQTGSTTEGSFMSAAPVAVGALTCGSGHPLLWILGPCVIESHDLTLQIAEVLAGMAQDRDLPIVFKASFDKANRSSSKTFRGPGLEKGLRTLEEVKR